MSKDHCTTGHNNKYICTFGCSLTGTVTLTTSLMGFSLYTSTIWVSQLLGMLSPAAPDWTREISDKDNKCYSNCGVFVRFC